MDAGVDAAPAVEPNLVFLTSTTHDADFGSVAFADMTCNTAAQMAGLSGQYVAWLSSQDSDARTRIGSASGWTRVDGLPFAQSLADLASGAIYYPPELEADGTTTRGAFSAYWTGSDAMGEAVPNTCGNWTSTDAADLGTFGVGLGGANVFTRAGSFTCDRDARFLCLGIDRQAEIAAPQETGRTAFLSTVTVLGSAGRAAFNVACQGEAEAAGLSGTFVAGLDGLTGQVDLNGPPWVRPDGTPVTSAALPLTQTGFVAPISQSAAGGMYRSTSVWTGVEGSFTNVVSTCTDWTSAAGMGSAASSANSSNAGAEMQACASSQSLFCFEL